MAILATDSLLSLDLILAAVIAAVAINYIAKTRAWPWGVIF
jgi:hypothetical protein